MNAKIDLKTEERMVVTTGGSLIQWPKRSGGIGMVVVQYQYNTDRTQPGYYVKVFETNPPVAPQSNTELIVHRQNYDEYIFLK